MEKQLSDVAETENVLARARADVNQLLQFGIPAQRICLMLRWRFSREILQQVFPNIEIPEFESHPLKRPRPALPFTRSAPTTDGHVGTVPAPAVQHPSVSPAERVAERARELAFQYVPLIQCTFPHSEQPGLTTYTRRNGRLQLTVATSKEGVGLPYGVPARLLSIYTATEVLRTRSREIYLGRTITDFLRRIDVQATSGERGTVNIYSEHLRRLIHAVFTVEENIEDGTARRGIHIHKVLFAEEARLWSDGIKAGKGSSILLSTPLYESILERSAPLALDAIRALRRSPLDLDLYAWLVYRLNYLRRPVTIPWSDLVFQFGQSYQRERDFRQFFQNSLKRVLQVYSQARVKATSAGLCLEPSPRHIAKASPSSLPQRRPRRIRS